MKVINIFIASIFLVALSGCATVLTEKANYKTAPKGVRVFPPKTYLFVSNSKEQTTIVTLPDYENAYDVNPLTIVADQNFSVQMDDGVLKQFDTHQNTTSFTELFKAIAAETKGNTGASGAGAGGGNSIEGTFGLTDGVYMITSTGKIEKINLEL